MFSGFYKDKRVLVTGHSGFKGGWLSLWLRTLGAKVTGYSLAPPTDPNLFEVVGAHSCAKSLVADIRDAAALKQAIDECHPDVVFHLAAQPIVRRSYVEPMETLETNVMGTAHLLEALRARKKKTVVVVVTSDKCYANQEWEFAYRESDPLGGKDVYSMSKASTELVTHAWNHSFFLKDPWLIRVGTGRAGNVIGGGDYAADRLIPDAVRSLTSNVPIPVRNPRSTRPWQHVLESLSGYLWLGACLDAATAPAPALEAVNFGPQLGANGSVAEVIDELLRQWPGRSVDASDAQAPHEARNLSVAIDRAVKELEWSPAWDFRKAISETVSWYRERHSAKSANMLAFSIGQIERYCADAELLRIKWSA